MGVYDNVCAECGKEWYCTAPGQWKHKGHFFGSRLMYFCSDGCKRKYAAKMDAIKKQRKKERSERMRQKNREKKLRENRDVTQ